MKKSRRIKAKKPVPKKAGRAPVKAKGIKKAGRAPVKAKGIKKAGRAPVRAKGIKKAGRALVRAKVIKKAGREQMKAVKNMLFDMKERLLKEIAENVKIESETLKAEIGDLYDIASRDRERELTLLLGDRGREKLMQIEEALGRIEEGSYGFCEECGEKISTGRLMVLPLTKVCVECKSKIEREEEVVKTLEEEGTYQSLVSFDLDEDES